MSFQYLTNVPLEQAKNEYLEFLIKNGFSSDTEIIAVSGSCGRVTGSAIRAHICAPHYAASAMDGIAVTASDTFGATETTPVTLLPDQYSELDTGDPIPADKDAVIMVEELVRSTDGSVTIHSSAAPWQHIRQIGEDVCAGEMILPSHTVITPAAIGAMIAGGVLKANVIRTPVIGIIPTGDEIIPPCPDPKPGDILEFNSSIFSSMIKTWGAIPKVYPIVPDQLDKIRSTVSRAAAECDMVILNAGSSAGREDFSAQVIRELGEVLYHGIAMKPGKPAILGRLGSKPVLGVPGYPVSGIIVIEELLKPLVDHWLYSSANDRTYVDAVLTRPVVSGLKYEEFVRVRMGYVGDRLMASPLNRGSGVVSSFMKADGILTVPQGLEGYEAGSEISVRLLCPVEKLRNSLVVIGSHDPLLDELADLIHLKNNCHFMSSTHVGSMGGIMAMRRGESHVAGCHLLDPDTGVYNVSFLKKYFPNGGVRLIRCVGRQQGLMVAKGNPLHITSLKDFSERKLRYVNRQKGSGTRILTDYLCKKDNVDTNLIYGYDREELTHNSVAVQILSESADGGMGIYSAAQLYDLDFIPVCTEEYDLLISERMWDTPLVQEMLTVLKSDEFRERLLRLGGYTIENPGEIISWS